MAKEANLPKIKLCRQGEMVLKTYKWPGNVRELSNFSNLSILIHRFFQLIAMDLI
jgi:DNA-binding NtrC family response regulator